MNKPSLFNVIVNNTTHVRAASCAGFTKASVFIKSHKIASIAIGIAVVASAATISVAAFTSGNEPVAMAPVVSKPAKIATNDQQQIEAVKSASTDTPATSTASIATNTTTQQSKTQTGQKATTSSASTSPAKQSTPAPAPNPTPAPKPATQPSFRIEIRDAGVYQQTFMGAKQLVVPFDIIMDSGFVANSFEQPFCRIISAPSTNQGVFCDIHQKEAGAATALMQYSDTSTKGHYVFQLDYSINGVVRSDSFSFDI
jgi:hypothetical protein